MRQVLFTLADEGLLKGKTLNAACRYNSSRLLAIDIYFTIPISIDVADDKEFNLMIMANPLIPWLCVIPLRVIINSVV